MISPNEKYILTDKVTSVGNQHENQSTTWPSKQSFFCSACFSLPRAGARIRTANPEPRVGPFVAWELKSVARIRPAVDSFAVSNAIWISWIVRMALLSVETKSVVTIITNAAMIHGVAHTFATQLAARFNQSWNKMLSLGW